MNVPVLTLASLVVLGMGALGIYLVHKKNRTDRGKSAHVLLSMEEDRRLTKQGRNIADALAMPGVADLAFDPQCITIGARPADLS